MLGFQGSRSRGIASERVCGEALSWRAKISAQVELEQPETAQKINFLVFSDALQNGVREICMNRQIVAAALRGDVEKSIAI